MTSFGGLGFPNVYTGRLKYSLHFLQYHNSQKSTIFLGYFFKIIQSGHTALEQRRRREKKCIDGDRKTEKETEKQS